MSSRAIGQWLQAHAEDMVDLQAALTACPAIGPENGGSGEWERAGMLQRYLAQHGFSPAEHYDAPDDRVPEGSRPNFMVRLKGRADTPRIWIMCHVDVVPPGEQLPDGTWRGWDSDPFVLRREGERIFGRGVEDNQQGIVAGVFAARALRENGVTPPNSVALLFVADEETGSGHGLAHVLREHGDLFSAQDIILAPDMGSADGSLIEIAEKSVLWLTFRVRGKQGHASAPQWGVNAFRAASRLVCALDQGLHERYGDQDKLYSPPVSTFEPTRHDGNVPNINTLPGEDVFCFDCRLLPTVDPDDVLAYVHSQIARVDEQMGTHTELTVANRQDAAPPTSQDAPAVNMLKRAVKDVYGVEGRGMGIGGATVAAFFRLAGYPAVVWSRNDGCAHQANEACRISNMVGDAQVFAHMFLQGI